MLKNILMVVLILTIAGLILSWFCCGSVARAVDPSAIYSEVTSEQYAEAEAAFAGVEGAVVTPVPLFWSDQRCQELLDKRDGVLIAVAGIGVLTGGSGLAVAIPEDASRAEKMGFGLTAVGLATTATVLTLVAKTLSERYEQNCRTERPVEAPAVEPTSPPTPTPEIEVDGGAGEEE